MTRRPVTAAAPPGAQVRARRAMALACAVLACGVQALRPPEPPRDADARSRAEAEACWRGAFPAWLDDDALAAAGTLDGREAQASRTNESFHGATYASQPPGTGGAGPRVRALSADRERFGVWCAALRSAGGRPPAP